MNYTYKTEFKSSKDLLNRFESLTGWADALTSQGAQVSVFQRFHRDESVVLNDVPYTFVRDNLSPRLPPWQIPFRLHTMIQQHVRKSSNSVVHINGLLFPLQTAHLRTKIPSLCPIIVQHHAERPAAGRKRWIQRVGLACVDGFFFTALPMAEDWLRAKMISSKQVVFQVMEDSTNFLYTDRTKARQRTGLDGIPQLLWVGRLNHNKDPLTVLAGFEQILPIMPEAQLAMLYHTDELLPEIQAKLASNISLKKAVNLIGRVSHEQIENYFNSADYFVLGSHHEGSGYALMEAMACGVIPVVTDIPSFRVMTDQGRIGQLWAVGSPEALADALTAATLQSPSPLAVRQYFERELSYPAIAKQALAAYNMCIDQRKPKTT